MMRIRDITIPTTYVLYVDNKPVQKYESRREALYTYDMISKKYPDKHFSVHAEICTDKEITELLQPELTDNKGFERKEYDEQGLEYTAFSKGNHELVIEVRNPQGDVIAQAIFRTTENDNDLNSDDTWVDKKYRRQGIATRMYNWAQELGNTVVPSKFRSAAGKKFWKSRSQQINELDFMGHACTKDCSGHRAGYEWSLKGNGRTAQTPSNSFNTGTEIGKQKATQRAQGGGKRPQYVSQTPDAIRKRMARAQARQAQLTTVGDTTNKD